MILAKLQRKKRNMSEKTLEHFVDLSGGLNPTQFIEQIKEMPTELAKEHIAVCQDGCRVNILHRVKSYNF